MATKQQRRQLTENRPSILLSREENDIIFSLLGKKSFTLSTAVVQLLLTEPPYHSKWQIKCIGVRRCLVWETELHKTFEYKTPRPFFHTFETHDCMAGLNFADGQEAVMFKNAITEKLLIVLQKRQERNTGFDLENMDPNLKKFLELAGVKQEHLRDENARAFIFGFIERIGGIDAVIQEGKRSQSSVSTAQLVTTSAASPQPSPPMSNTTTPRPPPPMPISGVPPPPPPMPSLTNLTQLASNDNHSALRKGKPSSRHHFEPDSESVKSNTTKDDPKNAILNQGVFLRSIEVNAGKADRTSNPSELENAILKAMQKRSAAIRPTDESDSRSESDEEDWKD